MKIFITGATGYIGGSVAIHLRKFGHEIRGLVRDNEKAEKLFGLGIEPVLGELDNSVLLIREAKRADAVINAASSDHRGAVDAFIAALGGSGKRLLHTSGSSVVGDAVAGNVLSEKIYDEFKSFEVGPEKRARYELDRYILSASGLRGIVLCNSLIYGRGKGLQTASVQIPPLVKQAQKSGVVRIVGAGLNRWSTVHIDDMCELYRLALDKAPGGAFYFVENGESSFAEIGQSIAKRLGLGPVGSWTEEEATEVWGLNRARYSLGSNSRVRGLRARAELGWQPIHGSATEWIEREMEI